MSNNKNIGLGLLLVTGFIGAAIIEALANNEIAKEQQAQADRRYMEQNKRTNEMLESLGYPKVVEEFVDSLKTNLTSAGLPLKVWKYEEKGLLAKTHLVIAKDQLEFKKIEGTGKAYLVGSDKLTTILVHIGMTQLTLTWDRSEVAFEKLLNQVIGAIKSKHHAFKVITPIEPL